MRIFHVTDKRNLESIKEKGLLAALATGKRKAVWGVTKSVLPWALLHTIEKPRAKGRGVADHVVIEIDVPRAWARRHCKRVWYVGRDIPPARFVAITEAAEIAENYPV